MPKCQLKKCFTMIPYYTVVQQSYRHCYTTLLKHCYTDLVCLQYVVLMYVLQYIQCYNTVEYCIVRYPYSVICGKSKF